MTARRLAGILLILVGVGLILLAATTARQLHEAASTSGEAGVPSHRLLTVVQDLCTSVSRAQTPAEAAEAALFAIRAGYVGGVLLIVLGVVLAARSGGWQTEAGGEEPG